MRPPRAVRRSRPRYPSLHAAWGLLVGVAPILLATPAFADATVPESGHRKSIPGKGAAEPRGAGPPVKIRLGGDIAYVAPPVAPPTERHPLLPLTNRTPNEPPPSSSERNEAPTQTNSGARTLPAAKAASPRPRPAPPRLDGGLARPLLPIAPAGTLEAAPARPMVLHCHGPDEPCRPIEGVLAGPFEVES